jgi:hypothetical protein
LRVAATSSCGEVVVGRALDEDAAARAAVLAGVVEDGVGGGGRCCFEVGVGVDHVRGLAAELERDALDRAGGALHYLAADLGRAGEPDLRDAGMLDEPPADDRALADDDIEYALGDLRLQSELGERSAEVASVPRAWDDGVPGRERRADPSSSRC